MKTNIDISLLNSYFTNKGEKAEKKEKEDEQEDPIELSLNKRVQAG